MICRRHLTKALPIVEQIRDLSKDRPTIIAASRTLDELGASSGALPASSPRTRFFLEISASYARPLPAQQARSPLPSSDPYSYAWYVTHYDQGFEDFVSHLTDPTEYSVGAIFGLTLSADARRQLRTELADPKQKYVAAALLAASGDTSDLKTVLLSEDVEVRQEGMNYGILNSDSQNVLQGLPAGAFARETRFGIEKQKVFKEATLRLLNTVPISERGLMLSALVAGAWDATPGLRIWSKSYIAALDGKTEDDAGELELFDGH